MLLPYSMSFLEEINPFGFADDHALRIFLIFTKFAMAMEHFFLTCSWKFRFLSKYTPRSDFLKLSPHTSMMSEEHFCRCCLLPKYMNSVLSGFIFSLVSFIYFCTYIRVFSSEQIVSASSDLDIAEKKPYHKTKIQNKVMTICFSEKKYIICFC